MVPYHAARVNVSGNAFSSSRSEKHIFFDVDIVVKNESKCGFSWSVHFSTTSTHNAARALSNPSRYFQLSRQRFISFLWYCGKKQIECSLAWSKFAPRESTTFRPLWWRVSLSIRVHTTLNHIRFAWICVVFILIENRYASSQWSKCCGRGAAEWVRNKFWALWWRDVMSLSITVQTTAR